jgi:hypothetical protein
MEQLGFQGYAVEYVDCPEGLMWFLKRDLNLHRTVCNNFIHQLTVTCLMIFDTRQSASTALK